MVPDNVVAAMRYCKPDNTNGYYDTMPDGTASFAVSENTVSVLLAPQMLTVPGTVVAQVVLYLGTQTLATFAIYIRVEADPSAGAVTSEDYVNWAQWIKSELDAYLEKVKTNGEFVGGTFVGDVNMNGHALSGLREPVALDDAATKGYVDKNAGTGAVSTVAGVAPDSSGNVPLTAESVKALPIAGSTMLGGINMNGQSLSGLNAPTKDDEPATKGYVDKLKPDLTGYATETYVGGAITNRTANNFTTTEEGFVADARALKTLNDSKMSMELLWQNGDYESEFTPHSVSLDLSKYTKGVVVFRQSTVNENNTHSPFIVNGVRHIFSSCTGNNRFRQYTPTNTKIEFFEGREANTYGSSIIDNASCIPYQIYGIK